MQVNQLLLQVLFNVSVKLRKREITKEKKLPTLNTSKLALTISKRFAKVISGTISLLKLLPEVSLI